MAVGPDGVTLEGGKHSDGRLIILGNGPGLHAAADAISASLPEAGFNCGSELLSSIEPAATCLRGGMGPCLDPLFQPGGIFLTLAVTGLPNTVGLFLFLGGVGIIPRIFLFAARFAVADIFNNFWHYIIDHININISTFICVMHITHSTDQSLKT